MIRLFDYQRGLPELEPKLMAAFQRVLNSGRLILGPETSAFEAEFAAWVGAPHAVAVHSGTAALYVSLKALGIGPGDEVITVANTCPPTASAIRMTGADIAFADVDPATLMLTAAGVESVLTPQTRAIVPVHLWGNAVDMSEILPIAEAHDLKVVEDCAQATGTLFGERHVGNFGTTGCFSFYPTKNLGAYGDGGAIVCQDEALAKRLRMLRMYGYDGSPIAQFDGVNARINELQAAMLRIKLADLDQHLNTRRHLAARLAAVAPDRMVPATTAQTRHSFHQFVVRSNDRAALGNELEAAGIQWGMHYENPLHTMPAFRRYHRALPVTERACDEVLSLPVHEYLRDDEVARIEKFLRSL